MTGECANKSVLRGLPEVFASGQGSDCDVIFCRAGNSPAAADSPSSRAAPAPEEGDLPPDANAAETSGPSEIVFGQPLTLHRLILTLASERFAAQLERWSAESTSRVPQPSDASAAAAASTRPQLRIPLGSEAEVPAARAAIRFAYTGEVAADHLSSVREVLEVRRQAAYLQMRGCAEACDEFLEAKLKGGAAKPGAGEGGDSKQGVGNHTVASQLSAVLQLYTCEALWPDPKTEPSFAAVVATAKRLLVAHFGCALKTLNIPALREQLLALPAVALEALLESDDFGTDNESTVLLLLATWMRANYDTKNAEIRQRLCRTVRLAHLGRPYTGLVLPAFALEHEKDPEGPNGWFCGVNVLEAAMVANFASAPEGERLRMLPVEGDVPSMAASLKALPRMQCVRPVKGLSYRWHITREELQAALARLPTKSPQQICGTFNQCPKNHLSAWGFEWSVSVQLNSGRSTAGLFLHCHLPAAVTPPGSRLSQERGLTRTIFVPISARLTVHRQLYGVQDNVQVTFITSKDIVAVGSGWGWAEVLPLRESPRPQQQQRATGGNRQSAAARDSLAAWADYLTDGKISGTLTLRPRP